MATLEELAAAMLGADSQKAIAAENPYYTIGSTTKQIADLPLQMITQAPGKFSTTDALAWALGSGLVNGIMQGMGDQYQNTLQDRYSNALTQAILGQPVDESSRLSSKLFGQAKQEGTLFKVQRDMQLADEARKFKQEREGKFEDKLLDFGVTIEKGPNGERILRKIPGLDVNSQAAAKKASEKTAELFAEDAYWNGQSGSTPIAEKATNPNSPQYKAKQDIRSLEGDYYNRITKLPMYGQFSEISNNFNTLLSLANEDSRPASVGMIASLARIWDPGGTVREGEYALNSNAQSALDSIIGDWREIVSGKGKLNPEGKKAIISAVAQKYNEFGKSFSAQRDAQYDALERLGGNRINVPVQTYAPFNPEEWQPANTKTINGINYIRVQGGWQKAK